MSDATGPRLSLAAVAALHAGNKIEAIKITRIETRLDLKEAKDLVDAYLANHPDVREALASRSSGGAFAWLFVVIVALAAVVYFWPGG